MATQNVGCQFLSRWSADNCNCNEDVVGFVDNRNEEEELR